jgi:hypothetical protein
MESQHTGKLNIKEFLLGDGLRFEDIVPERGHWKSRLRSTSGHLNFTRAKVKIHSLSAKNAVRIPAPCTLPFALLRVADGRLRPSLHELRYFRVTSLSTKSE